MLLSRMVAAATAIILWFPNEDEWVANTSKSNFSKKQTQIE